jgi:hypothetical protein
MPAPPKLGLKNGDSLPGLGEVLFLPLNDLARLPVGYVNLLCATALPDANGLDLIKCLRALAEWTEIVRRETTRLTYMFKRNPAEYNNSEAYFRVLVMITVLQRDLGVSYDPDCINIREFRHSREGFIHGLLTGDKRGTCANMPVLYAAVGRALGYPIYLVFAKGHLFCRWHSKKTGERFNIEASGRGLNVFPDDYYVGWPRPVTPQEVHHGIYLRNLDPVEELGFFMETRGHCLMSKKHLLDAIVAFGHAHRLAPTNPVSMSFLLCAINLEIHMRREGKIPCTYRQAEVFNRDDCAELACYTINERYTDRIAGVNIIENKPGRLA